MTQISLLCLRLRFDFYSIVLSNFLFTISQKTLSDLRHPTPAQETWKFSLLGRSIKIEYYRPSLLYQNLLLMSEFDQEGLSIQSFLMAIPVSFFDAPSSVSPRQVRSSSSTTRGTGASVFLKSKSQLQCDQIRRFLKVLCDNFSRRSNQIVQ